MVDRYDYMCLEDRNEQGAMAAEQYKEKHAKRQQPKCEVCGRFVSSENSYREDVDGGDDPCSVVYAHMHWGCMPNADEKGPHTGQGIDTH